MCHKYLRDARLFDLLLHVDRELAAAIQTAKCPFCGSQLDIANYRRKPRGHLVEAGEEFSWRFSFCCAKEGCRRRATPPSVRFLGRKVYLSVVVILISAVRQGPTAPRARRLKKELGVDRRTLTRWHEWWRETFPLGEFWQQARRQLFPACQDAAALPTSLLGYFGVVEDGPPEPLARCARFISPQGASLALCEHAGLWPS